MQTLSYCVFLLSFSIVSIIALIMNVSGAIDAGFAPPLNTKEKPNLSLFFSPLQEM